MTARGYHFEPCEFCDDGWVEVACGISNYERFGGSRSVRCDECGGSGEIEVEDDFDDDEFEPLLRRRA